MFFLLFFLTIRIKKTENITFLKNFPQNSLHLKLFKVVTHRKTTSQDFYTQKGTEMWLICWFLNYASLETQRSARADRAPGTTL